MMEVTNDFIGTVYYRKNLDDSGKSIAGSKANANSEDYGQQVKWVRDYNIKRFPRDLASGSSVPYLFSPNFTYQLDFNYRGNELFIRETKT
jgi:hypothetical protein